MIATNEIGFNDFSKITYNNGEATMKIRTSSHDEGFGILIKNTASSTAKITVKEGNSILAAGDLVCDVPQSSDVMINLRNTGRYKNVSGENAGYIIITISGATPSSVKLYAFGL